MYVTKKSNLLALFFCVVQTFCILTNLGLLVELRKMHGSDSASNLVQESSEPTGNHETDQKKLVPFITQPQIKKETSNLKDKTATPVKNEMSSLKDNETSVAVIGLVTFVGDASRGILFPVLWLLVQRVGGDLTDLVRLLRMDL